MDPYEDGMGKERKGKGKEKGVMKA